MENRRPRVSMGEYNTRDEGTKGRRDGGTEGRRDGGTKGLKKEEGRKDGVTERRRAEEPGGHATLEIRARCILLCEHLVRNGKSGALKIRHANILLAVDESNAGAKLTDTQTAKTFGVAVRSIETLRKRLVEEGLEVALVRRKQVRPSVERLFDGEKEASLIAVACGPKPEGRTRWTLELRDERPVSSPSRGPSR